MLRKSLASEKSYVVRRTLPNTPFVHFLQHQLAKINGRCRIPSGKIPPSTGWLMAATLLVVLGLASAACAQSNSPDGPPAWLQPTWNQARDIRLLSEILEGDIPPTIPQFLTLPDHTGKISSYQPAGDTTTKSNAFFQSLGTNGRTCFSCHQPQSGWALKPSDAQVLFLTTGGRDPLFAPVDGANCPDTGAAAKRFWQKLSAFSQLLTKGNFRIFLPIPAKPEWQVSIAYDPYGCETDPKYGITGPNTGFLSVYRRPLPAASLNFLTPGGRKDKNGDALPNIMWDAREPSLESQFIDATLVHAQAGAKPAPHQTSQGVSFQTGIFTAQSYDRWARDLTGSDGSGANGGPNYLSTLPEATKVGGGSPAPKGPTGTNLSFNLFDSFTTPSDSPRVTNARESIQRGQTVFNTKTFLITNVTGLNDVKNQNPSTGTCSTCHNNVNAGNDFRLDPKHTGIGDNSSSFLPPTPDQPLFSFLCPPGSITYFSNPVVVNGVPYDQFLTTDPGVGLITGKCADLGKMKVPVLRGLASRAPYFHGGNAATLRDLIDFYDQRFSIGLTDEEKQDLVNFLNTL